MRTICSLLLAAVALAAAAGSKTYNGDFFNGRAVYNYYEKPGHAGRIYDGPFSYTAGRYGDVKARGSFAADMRDGRWDYSGYASSLSLDGSQSPRYADLRTHYRNGCRDGAFTYTHLVPKGGERVSDLSISGTFADGVPAGSLTVSGVYETVLPFDSDGLLDGLVLVDFSKARGDFRQPVALSWVYNHGVLVNAFSQNLQTGDIVAVELDSANALPAVLLEGLLLDIATMEALLPADSEPFTRGLANAQ